MIASRRFFSTMNDNDRLETLYMPSSTIDGWPMSMTTRAPRVATQYTNSNMTAQMITDNVPKSVCHMMCLHTFSPPYFTHMVQPLLFLGHSTVCHMPECYHPNIFTSLENYCWDKRSWFTVKKRSRCWQLTSNLRNWCHLVTFDSWHKPPDGSDFWLRWLMAIKIIHIFVFHGNAKSYQYNL